MTLFDIVFSGNDSLYAQAEAGLKEALEKYGPDKPLVFPVTAYIIPFYYGITGEKISTVGEAQGALEKF